jgi:hypothetical protein
MHQQFLVLKDAMRMEHPTGHQGRVEVEEGETVVLVHRAN